MNEKKIGVMVATPCYGGLLSEGYLHGIINLTQNDAVGCTGDATGSTMLV